jgi:hypothetical protein
MKVINNKTRKQYNITKESWEKIKAQGKAGRYSVIPEVQAFKPKELKVETKKEAKTDSNKI